MKQTISCELATVFTVIMPQGMCHVLGRGAISDYTVAEYTANIELTVFCT